MCRFVVLAGILAVVQPAVAAPSPRCGWIKSLLSDQEDSMQKYALEIFSNGTQMRSPKMRSYTFEQSKPHLDMNGMMFRKLAEKVIEHGNTIERGERERCLSKAAARAHTENGEHFWRIGREAFRNSVPGGN